MFPAAVIARGRHVNLRALDIARRKAVGREMRFGV
jgi:hypothetical protein